MASKRKSTVPCMIPVKTLRPEQARRSPATEEGPALSESPAPGPAPDPGDNGIYTCGPCVFETRDLNLFLDHAYSGHPEFRAEPGFLCVGCGVGAAKFEGLALHNARAHPSTAATALRLRRRDRGLTVEQSVAPADPEASIAKAPIVKIMSRRSEPKRIAVSPVAAGDAPPPAPSPVAARVPAIVHGGTAGKVGSGAVPVRCPGPSPSAPPALPAPAPPPGSGKNLPKVMIPLSSIPTYEASMDGSSFLRTSFSKFPYPTKAELCYLTVVTQYPEEQIKIWFTAQRLKRGISWSPEEIEDARRKMFNTIIQAAPPAAAAQRHVAVLPASGVPHVLQASLVGQAGVIVARPLVSNGVQVRNAPTALAVTPRPQAAAKPAQARPQAAAPAADKGAGTLAGSVGGSNSAGGGAAGGVANQTSVISVGARPRSAKVDDPGAAGEKAPPEVKPGTDGVKLGPEEAKEEEAKEETKEEAKGDGEAGVSGGAAPPGKSESPPLPGPRGTATPGLLDPGFFKAKKSQEQLTALKESFVVSQFPAQEEVDRLIGLTGLTVREVRKWFSDRRYHFRNTKGSRSGGGAPAGGGNPAEPHENAAGPDRPKTPPAPPSPASPPTPARRHPRALSPDFTAVRYKEREPHQLRALASSFARHPDPPDPPAEEVERLRAETKMTRREIHAWFAERRRRAAAEKRREERERAEREDDEGAGPQDEEGAGLRGDPDDDPGAAELKVNPIKINLKMLRVTEADGGPTPEDADAPSPPPAPPAPPAPQPAQNRTKKTPDQLHVLKRAFARTHWPSSPLYSELMVQTGLPRPEVVRWFGDCRYVLKNGQLKWLESYRAMVQDEGVDVAPGEGPAPTQHPETYGGGAGPSTGLEQGCED